MAGPTDAPKELTSWKEVAAHLGVSIRTAQLWERDRGLPIRRLPGGRGQVRAVHVELDAWKNSALIQDPGTSEDDRQEEGPGSASRSWFTVALIVVVLACIAAMVVWAWPRHSIAEVNLQPDGLAAFDADGSLLWRYVTGTLAQNSYLDRETRKWVGDLDGDGKQEVLFVPQLIGVGKPATSLICLNESGKLKWRFDPSGRDDRAFVVRQFSVIGNRVLVTSHHKMFSPAVVNMVDAEGKTLWDYRHRGHLNALTVSRTGKAYLGGVDQNEGKATVVELNAKDGTESGVVLFPRSCLYRNEEYNAVDSLSWMDGKLIVDVQEGLSELRNVSLQFFLNERLEFERLSLSDSFMALHRKMANHPFSTTEEAELSRVIRKK